MKKRLIEFLDYLGISQGKFEKNCDLPNGFVNNMKDNITTKSLKKITSNYPELDDNWLCNNKGKMLKSTSEESNVKLSSIYITENLIQVPFVSIQATAGFIESYFDENIITETVAVSGLTEEELKKNKYIVFEVEGNSMYPTIQDKSQILTKNIDPSDWEYCIGVYVVCYKNSLVIKRIKKNDLMESNNLILTSDNEKGGEISVRKSDIHGIWKAVRIVNQKI